MGLSRVEWQGQKWTGKKLISRGLFVVHPEICPYGMKKPLLASVSTGSLGTESWTGDLPKRWVAR
jgi:hypothetical protein